MNKFFNFLAQSNRYKHLIGGFFVAMLGGALYPALYATIVAASCLELKDCLYGNAWDWLDWICTLAGGIVAASLFYIFKFAAIVLFNLKYDVFRRFHITFA